MNAYEIKSDGNYSEKRIVIAENFAQAETYYERKYVDTITEIKLYAQDVLLPTELTNE